MAKYRPKRSLNTDGKLPCGRHIDDMNQIPDGITLTAKQQQFAEQHRATARGFCTDSHAVCLYRDQPHQTIRWILDGHGHLLETAAFTRAA